MDPGRRRLLVRGAAALAAAVPMAWWAAGAGADDLPVGRIVVGTGVPSGVYARYGQLLSEQLGREAPGLEVVLRPSEGSVQNIERLVAGSADFVIATADSIAAHLAGEARGQRPGNPGKAVELRACVRLYDDYMQLVVPAGSPVRACADLAGLRVGVGQDGSGVQLVTRELLAAAGLDMESDVTAVREGIHTMPRMMETDRLDAFFWSGGLPTSAVTGLSERLPIRLVPLGELLPRLHSGGSHTAHYRAAVMPPDAYPAIAVEQAVDTVAVANLLVTRETTDADLTERVTRAVINGRDRIAAAVHAAQRVDLRTAIYTRPLELHEGARRYYRSAKL
ncbi:TAXI family TRAP transporter solute-binding subunit [Streptomyces alkaliphilus]|uniref:TAXI family TRAP transporter solute-binding subunit n=1 Tax=Streptomyces alkaliphilus TaxID=1472722 RepID=UPI003F66275B